MRERASELFPFAVAAVFPPAGLILALAQIADGERDFGVRLAIAAVLGAVAWVLVLTA